MNETLKQAKQGDFVKIHFTCRLKDGSIYDSSEGKDPLQFTLGEGEVLPFLEQAVSGMYEKDTKTILIKCEEVFGPYAREKAQVVDRAQFPDALNPEVGMQFQIDQADGSKSIITVTEVSESKVTLTPNHPLAGEDLSFDIQLLEVEPSGKSKAEEIFTEGVSFQDRGLFEDAISRYQEAIKLHPKFTEAFYNLGVIFQQKDMIDKAILYYEIAIGLNQEFVEAHHNLGIAFKEKGDFDEALNCFQRVIQLNPTHANAYYNLGNTLVAKGQFNHALQSYQKAVELVHDFSDAQWSIALLQLRFGNFEEGWKGYEWRWKMKDVMAESLFSEPAWDGSDIRGKSILLHAEQGFGDTIQFIRYAPMVAARAARVIVQCQEELTSLIRSVTDVHQVVVPSENMQTFDIHCPLLSLPRIFGTTLSSIPNVVPYLKPNPYLSDQWRKRLSAGNSGIKIGLVWAGHSKPKFGHSRSCPLDAFTPLSTINGPQFYSLQKGEAAYQAKNPPEGMQLADFTGELRDFADTAALIENLDLVISVDTAVAHLAGALGKPVWILLPYVPDWRWMMEGEESPWYPTMRLFRQPSPGDWKSVILSVLQALNAFVESSKDNK